MTTTLTVEGMGCEGCEDIVENAVTDVAGVEDATADQDAGTVDVHGEADTAELVESVEFAGYEASVES